MSTTTNDQASVFDADIQKIIDDLLSVDLYTRLEDRENQLTPKTPLLRPLLRALVDLATDVQRCYRIPRAIDYVLSIANDSDCLWFAAVYVQDSRTSFRFSREGVFRPKKDSTSHEQDIIQCVLPCLTDGSDHSFEILNELCTVYHGAFTNGQVDTILEIVFETPITFSTAGMADNTVNYAYQREYESRVEYVLPLVPHLSSPQWHRLNMFILRRLPGSLHALEKLTREHPVDQLDCEMLVVECLNQPYYYSENTFAILVSLLKGQKTFDGRLLAKLSKLPFDINDEFQFRHRSESLVGQLARLHRSVEWKVKLVDVLLLNIYDRYTDDFSASFLNLLQVPDWPQECVPGHICSWFISRVILQSRELGAPELIERLCKDHALDGASFLNTFSGNLDSCFCPSNSAPVLSMIRTVINTPAFADLLAVPESLFWQRVDPILVELRRNPQLASQAGVFIECARLGSSIDPI